MSDEQYPAAVDPEAVGTYPPAVGTGGGYVWDEVLEYRVWCHPERGSPDPLALILQREHINEPEPGRYVHVTEERLTEWPPELLKRPKRTASTISDFLSPDAPAHRLDIIRGIAK